MPHFDAYLFNKKGVKRTLELELEQNDGIIESIKQGMKEHGLKEVKIESADGPIDEITVNFFERNLFRSKVIKNANIMLASGGYKLSYEELFGSMKVVTDEKPPTQGTLVKGKAKDGLKLHLSFTEYIDIPKKSD